MEKTTQRILIVDDEPQNIQVLGNLLSELEFKTGFALNGVQALELLKKTNYDLILLDINMPELNGFDTCKIIRRTNEIKDIPIIFLTANASPKAIAEGFEIGGQDYITKPFNTTELIARIKTQIELNETRKFLHQYNTKLKYMVEKRTIELSEALASLSKKNEELQQKKEAAIAMSEEAYASKLQAELAKEALEESEERFRLLSENSIVGVFIIQNDIWKYVNPYMAQALGYDRDEMIGDTPLTIVHPEYQELVKVNMQKKLDGNTETGSYDIKCLTKGGEIRFVRIIGHKSIYRGSSALIGNVVDITDEKNHELEQVKLLEHLGQIYTKLHLQLKELNVLVDDTNKMEFTDIISDIESSLNEIQIITNINL